MREIKFTLLMERISIVLNISNSGNAENSNVPLFMKSQSIKKSMRTTTKRSSKDNKILLILTSSIIITGCSLIKLPNVYFQPQLKYWTVLWRMVLFMSLSIILAYRMKRVPKSPETYKENHLPQPSALHLNNLLMSKLKVLQFKREYYQNYQFTGHLYLNLQDKDILSLIEYKISLDNIFHLLWFLAADPSILIYSLTLLLIKFIY